MTKKARSLLLIACAWVVLPAVSYGLWSVLSPYLFSHGSSAAFEAGVALWILTLLGWVAVAACTLTIVRSKP